MGTKYQDTHSSGGTGAAHKDFKRVNFKDKEGFLRVARRGLTKSYKVK